VPNSFPDPPVPSAPHEAQELFRAAAAAPPEEAPGLLARLASEHPDALAESGVPLLPLVLLAQLRHATDPDERERIAMKLGEAAVRTHPSVLTHDLLESGERLLTEQDPGAGPFIYWRSQWEQDEGARAVLRHISSLSGGQAASPGWVHDETGEHWWRGNGELLVPHERLVELTKQALTLEGEELSRSISVVAILDGVHLGESDPGGEEMARLTEGPLTLIALLTNPATLYAEQSRQTAWLSALLASALLAVLAGFWLMRRSIARERQLGELKSNFVASVSHELRAPIASMRVMAENLESGVVQEEPRRGEYHRLISEECRRLTTLIDNVLDFARIEQDRRSITSVKLMCRHSRATRSSSSNLAPAQRRQTIAAELETVDPPPICDGAAIQQALINLLDNAIKFSPVEAVIAVGLRTRNPGTWELSVKDPGPGIAPAEHERIFERFYRIGSELCRETQGRASDSASCSILRKDMAGRSRWRAIPGRAPPSRSACPQCRRTRATNSNRDMARILIIEDELPMRTALTDLLQAQGYRVIVAADGVTGLERALEEKPDLILLDVMMPKLDGFAVCRGVRQHAPAVPILMLTAKVRWMIAWKGSTLALMTIW
jgi:signal transduction histidine kinase